MPVKREEFGLRGPDYDEVVADAETSLGRSLDERAEMFRSVQELVGAIWASFSEEEMLRRLRIGEELDPSPQPGWSRMRPEALPTS